MAKCEGRFNSRLPARVIRSRRSKSQSLVVLLSLIPIGVFVVTSTASVLSMGFFLGLAASIVTEMVSLYQQPDVLRQQFFWQLKTPLSDSQVQWVVNGAVILLGIFSILFVW